MICTSRSPTLKDKTRVATLLYLVPCPHPKVRLTHIPRCRCYLKVIMSKSLSSSGRSQPFLMSPNNTSRSPKAQWEYSVRYSRKSQPKAGLNSTMKYGDCTDRKQNIALILRCCWSENSWTLRSEYLIPVIHPPTGSSNIG